jgi:hypothetical protein
MRGLVCTKRMMMEENGEVGNFSPCNRRARSRCCTPESKHGCRTRSVAAVMPQVNHRIGEGFEGVVQLTDALTAKQQTPDLSSQANSRSMVRNRSSKMAGSNNGLRPRLGCFLPRGIGFMLGAMPRLKMALRLSGQSYTPSRLMMLPCRSNPSARAIFVSCGSAFRSNGDSLRLPAAATSGAITLQPVAEDDSLIALNILVTAIADVVAPFLGRGRRAIAMNGAQIQAIVLVKLEHRAFEDGVKTALGLPSPKGAVDACGVDLATPMPILLDGQVLPLATQIEHAQNVVEDRMKTERRLRAAAAFTQVRQDKLLELLFTQLRGNASPRLALRHI